MLATKAREVLDTLQQADVLHHLVLIGSWCGHFFQLYFGAKHYAPMIHTLDIDFLIPDPLRLPKTPVSVDTLLEALDFETDYAASGWLRFVHPELRVEFLIPRVGPQSDTPRSVPALNITAQPLRHTSSLTRHTITVADYSFTVRVPKRIRSGMGSSTSLSRNRRFPRSSRLDGDMGGGAVCE